MDKQDRLATPGTAGEAGGRRKVRETWAIVGAVIIAIAVLSAVPLALEYLRDSPPQETKVDELIREACAGSWDAAYLCATTEFRRAVTSQEFRFALESLPGFGPDGAHDLRWDGEHSERLGMVKATLRAADGREAAASFTVYRTVFGSEWLIADVEVDGRSLFGAQLYR